MTLTKRLMALTLAGLMLLGGCSSSSSSTTSSSSSSSSSSSTTTETTEVEIVPGGTADGSERKDVDLLYSTDIDNLNFLLSSSSTVADMATLVMAGLIQYNYLDQVVPGAAETWETSEDGLTWTFHLRDGLAWYDYEGNYHSDVTAQQYVDTVEYLVTAENAATGSGTITPLILNSQEYLDGTITDFSEVGVKALDDKTIEYTLYEPCSYFLSQASSRYFCPYNKEYADEQGDMYGTSNTTILYNGAYYLSTYDPQNKIVYTYNPEYWDVENIYISSFNYTYNTQDGIAATLFERGEIDNAGISDDVIEDYINDPEKAPYVVIGDIKVNTTTFKLNYNLPTYDEEWDPQDWQTAAWNSNFRKSLYYGLDRLSLATVTQPLIADSILNQTLTPSNYAYNTQGVDYTTIGALAEFSSDTVIYDPDLAKEYRDIAMAELEGEVEFPIKVVFTYKGTSTSSGNMLQVLKFQLENLLGTDYVEVVINGVADAVSQIRKDNNYSIFFNSWSGGSNDPYSYACIYESTNGYSVNRGDMWQIEEYIGEDGIFEHDRLVALASAETTDVDKRFELFAEAEAFLLSEALVIPFYENAYTFRYTNFQPKYCYHDSTGLDTLLGMKLMDEACTTDLYEQIEADIAAEKAALAS